MSKNILFINDKSFYNNRYRQGLMNLFVENGYRVISLGVFDDLRSCMCVLRGLLGRDKIVSSNLKSNIIFMLFPFKKGVVIINGFGRYRCNGLFRGIVLMLLRINKYKKIFVLQNYADWRYVVRYLKDSKNIKWFPGSGGKKRIRNDNGECFLVQRRDKLRCIKSDLSQFCDLKKLSKIYIVGCDTKDLKKCGIYNDEKIRPVGYLPQDDIFMFGNEFVQPSGYGEGFPHTLADAIVSGLNIYVSKKMYVQLGMYKMDIKAEEKFVGWMNFKASDALKKELSTITADNFYYNMLFL